ncbi:hypothetical protein [Ornithinicoccus halotolerans]|uniref:hypothetical protein n=1 Tax=Ornithinicoccus halotolerans TaxID=1748220 RepID=UPI0012952178|nr:hypothetical protein [Ornithinicoccus halotolerans]
MTARPERVLALVVGLVLAVAVAAAVVAANRPTTTVEPGTPEAVVQDFLTAVVDGDREAALSYLDPELNCDERALEHAGDEQARVTLLESEVDGDEARVVVSVSQGSSGPFETGEYSREETYRLLRTEDGWRISDDVGWPVYGCPRW